jgi:hypothetical protein
MKRVNSPSLGSNISYLSAAMTITASTNRSVPAIAGFGNFYFIMREPLQIVRFVHSQGKLHNFNFIYESLYK